MFPVDSSLSVFATWQLGRGLGLRKVRSGCLICFCCSFSHTYSQSTGDCRLGDRRWIRPGRDGEKRSPGQHERRQQRRTVPGGRHFRQIRHYFCILSTVCLGSTNNLALCWTFHGGMISPVVKNGPVSHIVPGCMTLEPRRARYCMMHISVHGPL